MSEASDEQQHTPPPTPEVSTERSPAPETKESSPPPPTAAFSQLSISIWPPSQRTRDAVINRLVETLSSASSVLAKRYGTVSTDEASAAAARIEADSFSAASDSNTNSNNNSVDDGIETLQIYSREISRRMLDFVKSRSAETKPAEELNPKPLADDSSAAAVDSTAAADSTSAGDGSEAAGEESVHESEVSQV